MFSALHMLTNERGQVRSTNFVATKAHQAFEPALINVRESLKLYGHQQPGVMFTDTMLDKNLLESAFPSLREGVTPVEKYSHLDEFVLPNNVTITMHDTVSAINAALLSILDCMPDESSTTYLAIGFDTEWNFSLSDHGAMKRGSIAIVQIAHEDRVYILQVSHLLIFYKLHI